MSYQAFFTANLLLAVLFVGWAAGGLVGPVTIPPAAVVATVVLSLFVGLWRVRPSLRGIQAADSGEWRALDRLRARLRARASEG